MTRTQLNDSIDDMNHRYEIVDEVLEHYKEIIGEYPRPQFLKDERKRLEKHLFKDVEFLEKLRMAITVITAMGWKTYIETM